MASAGVAKLKASLSAYLERVKAGEEIIVTEHGKPIAMVVPFRDPAAEGDSRLQRLYAAGIMKPPKDPTPLPQSFWDNRVKLKSGVSVLDALLAPFSALLEG